MNDFLKKVALAGQRNNKKLASTTTPKTRTTKTKKAMDGVLYQRTTVARVVARIKLKLIKGVAND